jgi:hypothetical protein
VQGPNLIGICHSMGGMAARHLDFFNNNHFGAIVTFGSPLRGARIANSVTNGDADVYISNGLSKLTRGPSSEITFIPQILGISISNWLAHHIVGGIAGSLSLRGATAEDLAEESGYNQFFYGTPTPTPKLFLWGEEDSPVHVRLAASFSDIRIQTAKFFWPLYLLRNPSILDIRVTETAAVDLWNGVRYFYGFMEDYNRAVGYAPWAFLARWRTKEWQAGHEYLFSQSEGQWRVLTGATFAQTFPISYWGPRPDATGDDFWYCANNNLSEGDCPYNQLYTSTTQVFIHTPTDGVVPVRSQIAEGTAWRPNDPNRIRRLEGDNHQSMRSSEAGRNELRAAFDRAYGLAFAIDRRL